MSEGKLGSPSKHATRDCPDCGKKMFPVKLIDATGSGVSGEGIAHVELAYAAQDADASFLTRTVTKSGVVKAALCSDCGRIILYSETPPRFFQEPQ
jgi:uncharacterized OB-fold protein